jgi:hypothetical protein
VNNKGRLRNFTSWKLKTYESIFIYITTLFIQFAIREVWATVVFKAWIEQKHAES